MTPHALLRRAPAAARRRRNSLPAAACRTVIVGLIAVPTLLTATPAAAVEDADRPPVYLTFDDGPADPGQDGRSLTLTYAELLESYGGVGTFFMAGSAVERQPAVARAIRERGHAIGNHSYSHPPLNRLSDGAVRMQLTAATRAIHSATGITPTCYRPPYGATDARVHANAVAVGLTNSGWTANYPSGNWGGWDIDTSDYRGSANYVRSQLNRIQGGEVVLMHDIHATSYEPLRDWLSANHHRFDLRPLPSCGGQPVPPPVDVEHPQTWYPFAIGRLYLAYFGRTPDVDGWEYWNQVYVDRRDLGAISQQFTQSSEFTLLHREPDDDQFVTLIYGQVLEREPDAEGHRYWRRLLEGGELTRGELMVQFSESKEYVTKTAPTFTGRCFNGDVADSFRCALRL